MWTDEARRCLQAIYDYIAEDNEPAAYRLVLAAGHPDIRVMLYGHYRLAYRVMPDRQVQVLGVFHGAMDIERHFKP